MSRLIETSRMEIASPRGTNGSFAPVVPAPHLELANGPHIDGERESLESIATEADLEACLSEPTEHVIDVLRRLDGDILILGAGGKMGPTLARMARRASDAAAVRRRVIAVSRFSQPDSRQNFEMHGIETVSCDLLDPKQLSSLPDCRNVVFMAGFKFGSMRQPATTWAVNTLLPALVAERFSSSRLVAFSTGNVYGMTSVGAGGSLECDAPNPGGEYAMSCLGRERMFEYFSAQNNIATAILRLNYACELRYGVLVDLAEKVWAGETIDLTMGYFNAIWQSDANAAALAAFDVVSTPPKIINVSAPEMNEVRQVCETLARCFNKSCRFTGAPATDAFLTNNELMVSLLGPVRWKTSDILPVVARWVERGGLRLGKPTHFQSRSGCF